ncbi:DUF2852 domain-containing protein [Thioclava sp. GXIMD4216]|uniref:DUF2852 domain-containing protein n=1 Tax=Thioclava sp. GXIMD4216 TaxID=3131929 RepID=UPI0030CC9BFB
MSYLDASAAPRTGPIRRAIAWMDENGPLSWIALMVASFIFAGPLGLLVLGFILFTGRFGKGRRRRAEARQFCAQRFGGYGMHMSRPSGNAAFDNYKAETIARLEREQNDFEAFLKRLRDARDKAEFDQYMDERARTAAEESPEAEPEAASTGTTLDHKGDAK